MKVYWKDGKQVFKSEDVGVFSMDGALYLEIGGKGNLWAHTEERAWYEKNVYPFARGDVLEIGMGLCCCTNVILSNPKVNYLVSVEKNSGVVLAAKLLGLVSDSRHKIINIEGKEYLETTAKKFDFIFIDTYIRYDDFAKTWLEEVIPLAKDCLKEGGIIKVWKDDVI